MSGVHVLDGRVSAGHSGLVDDNVTPTGAVSVAAASPVRAVAADRSTRDCFGAIEMGIEPSA